MNENIVYVGLDYHAKLVRVCALNAHQEVLVNRDCANDWRALCRAVAPLGGPVQAAVEACCGAAALADELTLKAGWSVDLAHPGYVSRMKQSPDKSDCSDARLLADLERVGYVPKVWQAPKVLRELRRLVHRRAALVGPRRNLKLRVGALLRDERIGGAPARPWTKAWLFGLSGVPLGEVSRWILEDQLEELQQVRERIARVEALMERVTRDDRVVQRLRGYRGIGLVSACWLRATVGRFDRFRSGKQLARFCGTSPRNASSGQRQATTGLIGACDRQLRAAIIEVAHLLKRFDPYWKGFADRLLARGKKAAVATAAVANRFIRRLYHEMKPLGLAC